jgi:hypothetical protein
MRPTITFLFDAPIYPGRSTCVFNTSTAASSGFDLLSDQAGSRSEVPFDENHFSDAESEMPAKFDIRQVHSSCNVLAWTTLCQSINQYSDRASSVDKNKYVPRQKPG